MHQVRPDPGGVSARLAPGAMAPIEPAAATARGLSGAVRRLAYRVPEHAARHWLLLIAADRLQVLEHRAVAHPAASAALLGALAAVLLLAVRRR